MEADKDISQVDSLGDGVNLLMIKTECRIVIHRQNFKVKLIGYKLK